MERPTVSIDLGASYTKVAYRRPLTRPGQVKFAEMNAEIVLVDQVVMIPSLVIKTGDRKRPWIMGMDAAGTTPSAEMKVFENWKSTLYSKDFYSEKVESDSVAGKFFGWLFNRLAKLYPKDFDSGKVESDSVAGKFFGWLFNKLAKLYPKDFDSGKVESDVVAGKFFGWLFNKLVKCGVDFDNNCRVRVTIPALKRIEEQQEALKECMKLNGWPDDIEVVVEPVANLIGVLSEGRNVVSGHGRISYGSTFGNWRETQQSESELTYVFDQTRNYAKELRTNRYMQITVIDFGSFTLDIAKLDLDLKVIDYDKFPVDKVVQESWEIGVIEDLDKRCLKKLFDRHGIDEERLPFRVKESLKVSLYSDEPYALSQGRVTLGEDDADKEIVGKTIDEYCQRAWSEIAYHCNGAEVVVLTGGGTCIPSVHKFFNDKLLKINVANIVMFPTGNARETSDLEDNCICDLEDVDEGMGRLATCVGAVSIGFGFDPDDFCRRFVRSGQGVDTTRGRS